MLNHQKLHYRHYYTLTADGVAIECSRRECFAPASDPTVTQRWYYSPDQEMAVRLNPGSVGDETHRANDADLKQLERWQERDNPCVAQIGAAKCEVTCDACPCKGSCDLKAAEKNGTGCKRKCRFCSKYASGTVELDKPTAYGDDPEERGIDVPDDVAGPEVIYIKKEVVTLIRTAVSGLSPAEQHLWNDLLGEKTKARIAAECGLTEGAIRKRIKKLASALQAHPELLDLLD